MVNTKGRVGGGLPASAATSASSFSWFIMYAINAGLGNTVRMIEQDVLVLHNAYNTLTGQHHYKSTRL